MQTALAAAAVALQQLLRWAHLALLALHLLRAGTAPQLAYAGPAAGSSGDNGEASASAAPRAAAPADQQQQQPIVPVIDFLSAATTGAVEHLRHTLMDAGAGLEPKMRALERTASSVQDTLFQAARAHSEAVRSNPQVGMWKQPSIIAVLSEEEKLRDAVFAQVYAELSQKDNNSLSFNVAQQQP
ncbi:hybrid NRPS PKS isoform B [Micractinium conductrix]|uniref:Hybrid NRPS PKS isoform A n=1 Tax=Micractinium conductrix TaxID=554055 RepID=A0A2P6VCR5_9CHLO|nr:hybrid NRPS PKS isoform A [Micractinium conductrix]PSC71878.1 hybrid NRPS PKS isoform B [Micractinium conductrix]|eukprot:PSC71877.1 hybrid NRPS PKS isoform A [Micractinium conductrix]